jgi:S1-C subfamily serine protease
MKRFLYLLIPAAILVSTAAFAGEGGGYGACEQSAQTCINMIAANAGSRGWMGVDGDVDKETGFYMISEVAAHSPAAEAGFKAGNILTAVNGTAVNFNNEESAQAVMAQLVPDAKITFTVKNDYGKEKDIKVTLLEMPEAEVAKMLGKHLLHHVEVADGSSR